MPILGKLLLMVSHRSQLNVLLQSPPRIYLKKSGNLEVIWGTEKSQDGLRGGRWRTRVSPESLGSRTSGLCLWVFAIYFFPLNICASEFQISGKHEDSETSWLTLPWLACVPDLNIYGEQDQITKQKQGSWEDSTGIRADRPCRRGASLKPKADVILRALGSELCQEDNYTHPI